LAKTDEALAATFDGSNYGPAVVGEGEAVASIGAAPAWLVKRLKFSGLDAVEQAALAGRAPLDIRVNSLRTTVDEVLPELEGAERLSGLDWGLRLPSGARIDAVPAYHAGGFEVQDAGSQRIALAVGAKHGDLVIDLCAGAGGKTLALAAAMQNRGEIIACDTDRGRLGRLPPRAEQAGATIVQQLLLNPNREAEVLGDWIGRADHVLVDAPCSGTGTWRRNPEARWRLTPARVEALVALQARLLAIAAMLVRPGGSVTYAVCSLLDEEGAGQSAAFLAAHAGWHAAAIEFGRPREPGVRLTPAHDSTDGFFVAKLVSPC
jgi:16S rRNA (cytosine967-C5)-methyltransferase